jgi:cytoskeletal protein CcmA (bactofilin family)
MSSKNFYGLTGDVTVDGGILNVGNAQLYANTETSNVGIGTTNAEFKLDVHGDANVENLYATYLHGDGSNIENIVSSQWEGSPGDPIYYTSNVGIANTSPVTKTLQVGSNLYVEDAGSNVIHVTGNVYADYFVGDGSQLTGIAASLDQIVDQGNTVSNTIQLVSGQDATSNVGLVTHEGVSISVSNANPTGEYQFGVGSNLLVNVYSSNVLTVGGNVFAQKMTLGSVTVTPAYNLQQITETGPTTNQTLVLSNVTTGLTADANVVVNGNVTAGSVITSGNVNAGNVVTSSNIEVGGDLSVTGNVYIDDMRVAEVASNLVTYDSTTGELMDSGGLFSNKLAVVSEQPPIALTGASTVVTNHGTYTIEASSGTVVNLFDKNDSTNWETSLDTYVSATGVYDGSASLAGHGGEWVKITMPYKTILRHIKIVSTNSSIKDIELVGLNADGLTWTLLKSVTGLNEETPTIIVNATSHHKTYGLIVRATNVGSSQAEIGDLRLFTESFSIDGGKVEMASSAVMGGETTMDQHGPHGRDGAAKLKKYPEIAFDASKMDGNDSTNTYIQAGYTVSASSQANNDKHPANLYEDNFPVTSQFDTWQTKNNIYDSNGDATSDYALTGITGGVGSRNGSYTTLELPHKIKLSYIQIQTRNSDDFSATLNPKQIYVYGSNNGSSWTQVGSHIFTNVPTSAIWQKININSTTPYNYFALQVTSVLENESRSSICQLRYYGYEELATQGDTSVDTTFTSIMNTPQTTGANVYVDGNLGGSFTNRVTGPDVTGTSATYDNTNKYWELNGSLESNIAVEANTFLSGDQPHAVSVWFNSSNLEANVSNTCVFSISDQEKLDSVNLDLQSNTWHNLTYAYQGEGGSRVTYLDGRKVAEDQAEDTFGEYPPFAMTGYSQGGYVVSASSEAVGSYPAPAYRAFDKNTNPDDPYRWASASGTYNTDGSYGGTESHTDVDGNVEQGEWLKIEVPHKLKVSYFEIAPYPTNGSQSWRNYAILGSNDDINWYQVQKVSGLSNANGLTAGSVVPTGTYKNSAFKYFVFIWGNKAADINQEVAMGELKLYGHRENDLVRLPDPTNVLKYPHIAMTGPAQRGYVASASSVWTGYNPWETFDENNPVGGNTGAGAGWASSGPSTSYDTYNGSTGENVGITSHHTGSVTGEWIQIELPTSIILSSIDIESRSETSYNANGNDHGYPKDVVLYGSLNGSSWSTVKSFTTVDKTASEKHTEAITSSTAYKYYALVVESIHVTSSTTVVWCTIGQLRLYGTGVDSIPIQIGGGNIDKVANFRVYDKFIGEDQAFEIWDAQKDAFGRAKSSMTLHKGRLGIGTTEPEGRLAVLDEPHNLEEFPPRAMTDYKTYFEGHGEFCVSSGDPDPSDAWSSNAGLGSLFDKGNTQANTHYYRTSAGSFDSGAPGYYAGSNSIGGISGAWIRIDFPYRAKLQSMNILTRSDAYNGRAPRDGYLLGKNSDEDEWTIIHEWTGALYYQFIERKFTIEASKYYSSYALVATRLLSAAETDLQSTNLSRMNISEWRLFGTREQGQSVLHDGQLTLTKNLTVPRIGPALDADDTPRRDRLVVEYNTSTNPTFEGAVRDTSGRGNDIVMRGNAKYDASEKAFRLDGTSGTYMSGTQNLGTGTPAHTITGWFKQVVSLNNWTYVMFIGTSANGKQSGMLISNTGQIVFDIYNTRIDTTVDAGTGIWHHFAGVFKGGTSTWDNASTDLYINGQLEGSAAPDSGTQYSFNLTGNGIQFGTSTSSPFRYFNGSISNFKLYDCALTAQEVKTLYDMGRTGHIVNPQPLHIAAPVQVEKTLRIPIDNTNTGTYTQGMIRYNTDYSKLQVHNGFVWTTLGGVSATGGTITYVDGYTIHTFTDSGTFTLISGGEVEYLVVAGGGGAPGRDVGGGGGAGGLLTGTLPALSPGTYTVTVGSGGLGTGDTAEDVSGMKGSNSTFGSTITATGGGAGKPHHKDLPSGDDNGGSGGGGAGLNDLTAGTGISEEGFDGGVGGANVLTYYGGGGGGGAGQVGSSAENGRHGGNGIQSSITGTTTYYAGGGGGAGHRSAGNGTEGVGGLGGGGPCNQSTTTSTRNGTDGLGGGGGASRNTGLTGGNGGSGIVIIRYLS